MTGAAVAARQAAWTLWLPVLVPLVTGMLSGCRDCAQAYLLSAVLVPGVLVPVWLRLDDAPFFVVAGLVTLLLYALTWWALARLPKPWRQVVQAAVVVAVAFEAIGFAHLLRA